MTGLDSSYVYDALMNKGIIQPWKKAILKDFMPPKFAFIAWLSFIEKLRTKDKLTYLEIDLCTVQKPPAISFTNAVFRAIFGLIFELG